MGMEYRSEPYSIYGERGKGKYCYFHVCLVCVDGLEDFPIVFFFFFHTIYQSKGEDSVTNMTAAGVIQLWSNLLQIYKIPIVGQNPFPCSISVKYKQFWKP